MQNGNAGGESVPGVDTEQISKATRAAPAGPDWEAIRADYIAGMSYNALAGKYHIRKETICNRGGREQWGNLRAAQRGGPVPSVSPEPFAELTGPQASALTADTLARRALKLARENEDDRILEAAARIMSRAHQVMMEQGRVDGGGVRIVIDQPDGCGD